MFVLWVVLEEDDVCILGSGVPHLSVGGFVFSRFGRRDPRIVWEVILKKTPRDRGVFAPCFCVCTIGEELQRFWFLDNVVIIAHPVLDFEPRAVAFGRSVPCGARFEDLLRHFRDAVHACAWAVDTLGYSDALLAQSKATSGALARRAAGAPPPSAPPRTPSAGRRRTLNFAAAHHALRRRRRSICRALLLWGQFRIGVQNAAAFM